MGKLISSKRLAPAIFAMLMVTALSAAAPGACAFGE